MRKGVFEGEPETDIYGNAYKPFEMAAGKPVLPEESEIKRNSRARSAKLRIAVKQQ